MSDDSKEVQVRARYCPKCDEMTQCEMTEDEEYYLGECVECGNVRRRKKFKSRIDYKEKKDEENPRDG